MLFPLRRVPAFIVSAILFSLEAVNGRSKRSSSSDCDEYLVEDQCNDQWSCEWKFDEEGNGYCATVFAAWVISVIVIGAVGGCIFCCAYTRYQKRRRRERAQNTGGQIHQPAVALQTVPNPIPPTASHAQQSYPQPYNQAYNTQANYNAPPGYYNGGASIAPPPPAYQPEGQTGAA